MDSLMSGFFKVVFVCLFVFHSYMCFVFIVFFFITKWYSIVCLYHHLFIPFPCWTLQQFPVWDYCEQNCYQYCIQVFVYVCVSFLLGKYLGMKWLGHMLRVNLTSGETAKLLSNVVLPFCKPIISVGEFYFLHILTNNYYQSF